MTALQRFCTAATVALACALPASATTLAPLSVEQMTDAADLVVRGRVVTVWGEFDENRRPVTRSEVLISEAFKGVAEAGDYVTVDTFGGVIDGRVYDMEAVPRFSEGEDVFLFLGAIRGETAWGTIGMALGKFTVKQNPADGSDMVVRFAVPYAQNYDARFIPNPPAPSRVSLSSFQDRVATRVRSGWDGTPIPGISAQRLEAINRLPAGVR